MFARQWGSTTARFAFLRDADQARRRRRHFLGVTGLGLATSVLGTAMPGFGTKPALAQGIGTTGIDHHSARHLLPPAKPCLARIVLAPGKKQRSTIVLNCTGQRAHVRAIDDG